MNHVSKCPCQGFVQSEFPALAELTDKQDSNLFASILASRFHVLHQLLPPIKETSYSLRPRAHNQTLPQADERMRKTFVIRMQYRPRFSV